MTGPVNWLCSSEADTVTGHRFIVENWMTPALGFGPPEVGDSIGWPVLFCSDRTSLMT